MIPTEQNVPAPNFPKNLKFDGASPELFVEGMHPVTGSQNTFFHLLESGKAQLFM
jgi:hypothetical protein